MRRVEYNELLAVSGLNNDKLKVLRLRKQIALAFGQSDLYRSLSYIELDAVALRLPSVMEKLDRKLAADVVRDQWGVWSRVVAMAESAPAGTPCFWWIIEYSDPKNTFRWFLTMGSMLDDREQNLVAIASDLHERTGMIARHYHLIEMQAVLADVRASAKKAKVDFSGRFLPPYGSTELAEILKPIDATKPDRAIVVSAKEKSASAAQARRAGEEARKFIERGLLQ